VAIGKLNAQKQNGKNILAFAPISISNESNLGIGFQYERMLDKHHYLSIVLPFAMMLNAKNSFNRPSKMKYLYPGVKFYPETSNRVFSPSFGFCFAYGFGEEDVYEGNGSKTYKGRHFADRGAVLHNIGLNFQPIKQLYISIETGVGFITFYNFHDDPSFYDLQTYRVQFYLGYRF
jgi:hypothetical protein